MNDTQSVPLANGYINPGTDITGVQSALVPDDPSLMPTIGTTVNQTWQQIAPSHTDIWGYISGSWAMDSHSPFLPTSPDMNSSGALNG